MAHIVWQRHGLSWNEVCRRAGARRRWNGYRRRQAERRQGQVWNLLCQWGEGRGIQREIAARLQVSPATISRDVAALRHQGMW